MTVRRAPRSQRRRLAVLLGLNLLLVAGLVIVAVAAHSLGLLAAGGDAAADAAAILLGIVAVTVRQRVGPASKAPTVVALVNGGALLAVTLLVIGEAVRRLLDGTPEVHGLPVLLAGGAATVVMAAGVLVLGPGAAGEDLHMRSVVLDTVADGVSSAAVAGSGAVILAAGGLYQLDSLVALLVGLVIGAGAVRLLADVVRALRSGAPVDLDGE